MKIRIHAFVQYANYFDYVILASAIDQYMSGLVNPFVSIRDTVAAESDVIGSRGRFQSFNRVAANSMRVVYDVLQALENQYLISITGVFAKCRGRPAQYILDIRICTR
ncbi:MAG: hypothetical protein SGJ19_25065 [Planctomycetia bacterium]|nr:hypothetical protein [Planctomycetia bacterium]